jgi:molecular chaperone DnaK
MKRMIGIDFGTTNSLCAWMDGDQPLIIPNDRGERSTPSALARTESGELLVGASAKNQALADPSSSLLGVKRLLGKQAGVRLGAQDYEPEDLAAAVLRKLKLDAERYLGFELSEAVVTVPARFSDPQRRAVREAAGRAGLRLRRIMNEPTAAALARAWSVQNEGDERLVLVYDYGGGTFDATVLRARGAVCRVLSSEGDDSLGGMDLDAALYGDTALRFKREFSIDPAADPYLGRLLLDLCEKAKIELSSRAEAIVAVPFLRGPNGVQHPSLRIERGRFEELALPFIERSMALVRKVLASSGAEPRSVDALVLSGGSSRIPLVSRMLEELTGRRADPRVNPEEIVAQGAAIEAARLDGSLPSAFPGFEFTDLCSRTFGLEIDGGGFVPLIKKDEPLPSLGQRVFTTVEDYQKSVEMHVLQIDDDTGGGRVSVGRFLLPGIRAAKRGEPRILVEFSLDEGDMLKVRAKDLDSGAEQAVSFFDGRENMLNPVEKALSLAERARREAQGAQLDSALMAELDDLCALALECSRTADNDKAGHCATLLEGLLSELAARSGRRIMA